MIDTWPFFLVLVSAVLHAAWNAMVRASPEPGEVMACAVMASGLIGLAGLLLSGLPEGAAWPWLLGGVIINTIGIRLAMAAYQRASYGLAYPVMRAGIPLLSLPVGALLLQEWPRPSGVIGVLLIGAALIMLALAAHRAGRSELCGLGFALLAAVAGAGYVAADAVGVRLSGGIFSYCFAVALGNCLAMAALMAVEGRNPLVLLPRHARLAATISLLSTTSFVLYIFALAVTPVALAAALRETSVLFAMVIAHFVLREKVGRYQWMAAGLAVAGVAAIRLE
jgi:drug/metabolite transporter (DMT)-like permease